MRQRKCRTFRKKWGETDFEESRCKKRGANASGPNVCPRTNQDTEEKCASQQQKNETKLELNAKKKKMSGSVKINQQFEEKKNLGHGAKCENFPEPMRDTVEHEIRDK